MVWKPATPQLELVLPGAPASQFHPTAVERRGRRSGSLIRQALYLDQEDAYAAGEAVPQVGPRPFSSPGDHGCHSSGTSGRPGNGPTSTFQPVPEDGSRAARRLVS
jgi:hypothetical protein